MFKQVFHKHVSRDAHCFSELDYSLVVLDSIKVLHVYLGTIQSNPTQLILDLLLKEDGVWHHFLSLQVAESTDLLSDASTNTNTHNDVGHMLRLLRIFCNDLMQKYQLALQLLDLFDLGYHPLFILFAMLLVGKSPA